MVYVLEQIIITGGLHVVDRLELARFKIIGLSVLERQITDGYLVVIIYRPLALIPHRLRRKGHYKAYARYVMGGPERSDKLLVERSEEHTSELQSRQYLVCRLLLE